MDTTALASFLEKHPSIKHYPPSSPDFDKQSAAFVTFPRRAASIVRPQSAADVSALVAHCAATATPFVVASGSHDLDGRSQVEGALRIDMRDIAHVEVSADRRTARVGGGTLSLELLDALAKDGVMTPTGTFPTVGYAGWITQGGYSGTMGRFGLGIDQLVGARVVNYKGECVEADEDLLEGMRGGGGNFGIIVELTVKVYPREEVQGGLVLFGLQDREADIKTFFSKWNDLVADGVPERLCLYPGIFPVPDAGPCAAVVFTWVGPPSDEEAAWRAKVEAMGGPVLTNTIKATNTADMLRDLGGVIASTTYPGRCEAASFGGLRMSDGLVDVLARHGAATPPTALLACFHVCHGYSTRETGTPALFRHRVPHAMLEIVGTSATREGGEECRAWAEAFGRDARGAEGALEGSFLPITSQDVVNLEEIYGDKYGRLLELKKRFDPHNVFRNALPRLEV